MLTPSLPRVVCAGQSVPWSRTLWGLNEMTFFDLCVAVLLFFNSAAVLNEHRFLAKRACAPVLHPSTLRELRFRFFAGGWYAQDFTSGTPGTSSSLKGQALGIITAVSYMRSAHPFPMRLRLAPLSRTSSVPLIVINTVVILVKLVFG